MKFIDFLKAIHVGGLIEECKLEMKENSINCVAISLEGTIMADVTLQGFLKGVPARKAIAFSDLGKVINMLMYGETVDDPGEGNEWKAGEIWVELASLKYEGHGRRISYRLVAPELIKKVENMEKTVTDYIDEMDFALELNSVQIRKLDKAMTIVSSPEIRFYKEDDMIMAEIGAMDSIIIGAGKYQKLTEEDVSLSAIFDARSVISVLKTVQALKGSLRMYLKDNFHTVLRLENLGKEINAAYFIPKMRDIE